MNNDPHTHGLWETSAPPPPETAQLNQDLEVDVVIMGAGFTGCSAALHLAEAGVKVAILEAKDIGFGGSGRNVGLVNAGLWIPPNDVITSLGNTYGSRLLDTLGQAPQFVFELIDRYDIQCEPQRTGTLHCANNQKGWHELVERAKQWQDLGAAVELVDHEKCTQMVGTPAYHGALLDHRAGTIQPLAYVRGLAQAAINKGAMIYTQSPVVHAEQSHEQWKLSTDHAHVLAKTVIVATNAYTQFKHPWAILREQIVHLPYFNLATPILSPYLQDKILPQRQGVWDTKNILSSFRFNHEGRLVFGSVGALKGMGKKIHKDWGVRALLRLFPELQNVEFDHTWYGSIGMTNDAIPRFHELAKQVYTFTGYNGRGIAPGTVFGKVLADLATQHIRLDDLPLPVTHPQATPFRGLKETYYEIGASIAHWAG